MVKLLVPEVFAEDVSMKKYSDKDIVEKFKQVWSDIDNSYDQLNIEVLENTKNRVRVSIWKMYEAPGLSFEKLKALSEFF